MTEVQTRPYDSQSTKVEQTRAIAEVQAAVLIAQQNPRDEDRSMAAMRRACSRLGLAQRAFFSYPKAGQTISGASVHLARELARCWGNIQFGIAELGRDDEAGMSEMLAFAWDLESNARSTQAFLVPHGVDTQRGRKKLVELRDIYENNANLGSRRMRETIFSVLPIDLRDEAQDLCRETLARGNGRPLSQRIADAIHGFENIGITQAQIETKLNRSADRWDEQDVADLGITFLSLQRKEITREDAFPQARVTTAEIIRAAAAGGGRPPADAADRSDELAAVHGGQS